MPTANSMPHRLHAMQHDVERSLCEKVSTCALYVNTHNAVAARDAAKIATALEDRLGKKGWFYRGHDAYFKERYPNFYVMFRSNVARRSTCACLGLDIYTYIYMYICTHTHMSSRAVLVQATCWLLLQVPT